jgi:F0F1-type ATP synthase membrane subunit b/b'
MIDERKKKIAQGVQDADDAAKRLRDVAAEKDTIIASARRDAGDIVAQSKQKAQHDAVAVNTPHAPHSQYFLSAV